MCLSDSNELNLSIIMNSELMKVCKWLLASKLALNFDKTVYLLFQGKKTVTTSNKLYMFSSADNWWQTLLEISHQTCSLQKKLN